MGTLANLSKARKALAEAKTLDDVLEIRDQAEAIRTYCKAAQQGLEAQNEAAEIKLRAERKAGELLARMEKNNGAASKRGCIMQPRLDELGIGKTQSFRWQKEASVPENVLAEHINKCNDEQIELTQASVLRLAGAVHVSQNSSENEWYTPPEYIEAARATMGGIDLDPASSDVAQKTVKAKKYFTVADDGLSQKWRGRVWMNPPYSKDLIGLFVNKLIEHWLADDLAAAVVLVNNATETTWFQSLAHEAVAMCFVGGRIKFLNNDGVPANTPLQGQAIIYYGPDDDSFYEAYESFGFLVAR